MAGLKEIRRRIGSVSNTKQITRAMKLVSAAKLRRAQESAVASRHYGEKLRDVLTSVVLSLTDTHIHPLMEQRSEGPRRIIVVAGERGLCGAYNTNVMKAVMANHRADDEYVGIGRRAVAGLTRLGVNVVASYEGLPEDPARWPINEIADKTMADFAAGQCREVIVIYTRFVSALSSQITQEIVLPVSREVFLQHPTVAALGNLDAIERHYRSKFDIPPTELFDHFVPFAIRAKVREATLEAKASEHASRMTAMDNATRNATDLIERLKLFYNRARQSAITRELIDIVGGAEAVK